jgi:hypothetical protein
MIQALKHGGIVSLIYGLIMPSTNEQFFFFACMCMIAATCAFFLPETKGRSLEDMDIIFGAITQEQRDIDIAARFERAEKGQDYDNVLDSEKGIDEHREKV